MATVIDRVSDDDQRHELMRYVLKLEGADLKDAKKVDAEIASLVANQTALLTRVLDARTLNLFIGVASEAEAENSFNLLFTLLRKQPQATADPQFAKVIEFLTSDSSAKQPLRLRILYNFAPSRSPARLNAFVALINYALATKSTEMVLPQLKKLRPRLQEWNASKEQTRQIFSTVRKVHLEQSNTYKAHKTSLKILGTYEGESADNLNKVAADAAAAIVEAINLPDSYQFDHILNLAAVKQLANSADSLLHKLLSIFTTENLAAFEVFNSANPNFLQSKGLSYPECRKKMQLLSLASLAAEQHELPYDRVAESLQIKPEEVEHWIISAIGAELIDAKMDQLRRVVIVTRAAQRVFTTVQWKQLSGSLQAWRTNLQNVLKVIQSSGVKADKEATPAV